MIFHDRKKEALSGDSAFDSNLYRTAAEQDDLDSAAQAEQDKVIQDLLQAFDGMTQQLPSLVERWINDHPETSKLVLDGSITNEKLVQNGGILSDVERLKSKATLYNFHLSDTRESGCMIVVVFPNGKVLCCDTGDPGQEDAIDSAMERYGIVHIDILITTHFHGDHIGCFDHVARTYCDNTTVFYRCIDWDVSRISYSDFLTVEQYETIVSDIGATSCIPIQNQVLSLSDDVQIRFLNCDAAFLDGYYSAYSDTDIEHYVNPSINNLSLITEITFKNKKILLCGDAEYLAQKNNADFIKKVDVLNIPHHNWNMNGFYKFFENACPNVAFFNRNNYLSPVAGCPHFWDKIKMQCLGEIPTYQTLSEDVVLEVGEEITVKGGDLYTYQSALANYNNVGDVIMGRDIPYYTSEKSFWENNDWSIADVLDLYKYVPYTATAIVYTNSDYFKKFGQELAAMAGTAYTKYILLKKENAIMLSPSAQHRLGYTFVNGFDYADSSTWATKYFASFAAPSTLNLQGSTALSSSDDLFDLKILGEYYASTNAIASGIANSPTSSAFRLEIGYSNGTSGRRYMRLTDCTGREWYSYKNENQDWQKWKVIVS